MANLTVDVDLDDMVVVDELAHPEQGRRLAAALDLTGLAEVTSCRTGRMRVELQRTIELAAGCWKAGLLDGRVLPDVATDLVVQGVDVPSVVDLAGLDLGPFDPRDAGDLLVSALDELGLSVPGQRRALTSAAVLIAWAVEAAGLPLRRATGYAFHFHAAVGLPNGPPELRILSGLEDEYDLRDYGYTHRTVEEIDGDARDVFRQILAVHSGSWIQEPVAARLLTLFASAIYIYPPVDPG